MELCCWLLFWVAAGAALVAFILGRFGLAQVAGLISFGAVAVALALNYLRRRPD